MGIYSALGITQNLSEHIDLQRVGPHFEMESHNFSVHNSTPASSNVSSIRDNLSYGVWPKFEEHISIIVSIIFGVICVVGVIGNSLVITVVLLDKQMRSTTNILILSLAVADLLFVIFCVPFTAVSYTAEVWPFDDIVCKIVQYALYTCAYASVYTLVLMAIDRYLSVVHPLRSLTLRTERNVWIAVAVVWIVVLCGNTPLNFYYCEVKYVYLGQNRSLCTFVRSDEGENFTKAFFGSFLFVSYVIPLGITIVLYGLMVRKLLYGVVPGEGRQSAESLRVKKRISVLVITVTVIFAVSWMPIQIILFWDKFGNYLTSNLRISIMLAANCLAYMNSCVNPILYAFMSQTFYQSFRKLLCCLQSSRRVYRVNRQIIAGTISESICSNRGTKMSKLNRT